MSSNVYLSVRLTVDGVAYLPNPDISSFNDKMKGIPLVEVASVLYVHARYRRLSHRMLGLGLLDMNKLNKCRKNSI